eukprot:1150935-Pelagomonas_calceolata.AAC.6
MGMWSDGLVKNAVFLHVHVKLFPSSHVLVATKGKGSEPVLENSNHASKLVVQLMLMAGLLEPSNSSNSLGSALHRGYPIIATNPQDVVFAGNAPLKRVCGLHCSSRLLLQLIAAGDLEKQTA